MDFGPLQGKIFRMKCTKCGHEFQHQFFAKASDAAQQITPAMPSTDDLTRVAVNVLKQMGFEPPKKFDPNETRVK